MHFFTHEKVVNDELEVGLSTFYFRRFRLSHPLKFLRFSANEHH